MIPASNNLLLASATEGYNLTRSLRFRASASAYLSRTPAVSGNRQKWTWSGWVKRGKLGAEGRLFASSDSVSLEGFLQFNNNDTFTYSDINSLALTTTQVFRDPSAWYHIVVALDTTQAVASDRAKIYVNGSQVTSFSTATYPAQNSNEFLNQAVATRIGSALGNVIFFDGYLAEVNFIDGQALTPSSFGSTNATTGVWQPARYTGTYGTNGFYLPFTDNSALTTSSNVGLGKDFSGNGNYWVTNNISITAGVTYDSMTDVPTLTSASASNYSILGPLSYQSSWISDGNLQTTNVNAYHLAALGSIGVSSGKWYAEITPTSITNTVMVGIAPVTFNALSTGVYLGSTATSYSYRSSDGNKGTNTNFVAYGSTWLVGDVIGVALDMDAGTLTFYKNNVSQGVAFSGILGTYTIGLSTFQANAAINFGQRPFAYTPPTGFVALNAYNLPSSTIVKGNTVMDATTYTGNGSTQTITNAAGFKPDLVWMKVRSQAYSNILYDSVRGTGTTKMLESNTTDAEGAYPANANLTSFNSNGFSVGSTGSTNVINSNTDTFVAWQWQAGQGTTSTNTSGSITSTVSVNASAGFSIVTYTGTGANATVGHGLGAAPSMIFFKNRTSVTQWIVYHQSTGNNQALYLNLTNQATVDPTAFNNTSPTSSVFTVSTNTSVNQSTNAMVAYCWSEIAGFSKFGSYTGNGSADGPFVYLGFRPKFILWKRIGTTSADWTIFDSARDTYNVAGPYLNPNGSNAELTDSTVQMDLLSNGFKVRGTWQGENANGYDYMYAAFAENPFKYSLAR